MLTISHHPWLMCRCSILAAAAAAATVFFILACTNVVLVQLLEKRTAYVAEAPVSAGLHQAWFVRERASRSMEEDRFPENRCVLVDATVSYFAMIVVL